MKYRNLIVRKDAAITTVTFCRTEALNALNMETRLEFQEAVNDIQKDDNTRVVIITGKGRSFIAGADAKELIDTTPMSARRIVRLGDIIEKLDKPVIAAVNGFALGGGCEVAIACDIVVASETAKFGQPEINLGLIPGGGGTQRLPRLVGVHKAKELVFTGEIIDANEAERIGLVNKVVPAERLDNVVRALAEKISGMSPIAIRLAKAAINQGLRTDLEAGLKYEQEMYSLSFTTQDKAEGVAAFLDKRKPRFRGT